MDESIKSYIDSQIGLIRVFNTKNIVHIKKVLGRKEFGQRAHSHLAT